MQNDATLLSPRQLADELGVTRSTIYRRIASGQLRAVRLGERGSLRVPASALGEFFQPAVHERKK